MEKDKEYMHRNLKSIVKKSYSSKTNIWNPLFGLIFTIMLIIGIITMEIKYFVGAWIFYYLTDIQD